MESEKLLKDLYGIRAEEEHLRKRVSYLRKDQFNTREEYLQTKHTLEKERDDTTRKRVELEREYDAKVKKEKEARIEAFLRKNIEKLVVEKDRTPLPINKDKLTVRVTFTNCTHTKDFPLNDLIPYEQERLWQDIINGMAIKIHRSCEQCREEKKRKRELLHRYDNRPIGHALLTIRGMR